MEGEGHTHLHGRNKVKCCLGQRTSLAPPCSNLRSFGSKCAEEESTCDIVVTYWHPHSDSVPRELHLLAPPLLRLCPPTVLVERQNLWIIASYVKWEVTL